MSESRPSFEAEDCHKLLENIVQKLESNIEVGLAIFLEVEPRSLEPARHRTILRGWESQHWLLLEKDSGRELLIARIGQPCVVRFMSAGAVWAFNTAIADFSSGRMGHLIRVKWPRECYCIVLRRHERLALAVPCMVHAPGGSETRATLLDLSVSGCCFSSNANLETDSNMAITFMLPGGIVVEEEPILIRNRQSETLNQYKYGCEFCDPATGERAGINLFINRTLAQQRERCDKHVLLVTDQPSDAETLQELSIETGCPVTVANGVMDACHQIRVSRPLLILVNSDFQEMAAPAFCALVRGTPGCDTLPTGIYGGPEMELQQQSGGILWLPDLSATAHLRSLLLASDTRRPR